MLTALKLWTNWASALRKQHTLQSNVNCAVKSSAVPKITQSRNFNCTNLRIFQHSLDLTAQLLTVQLKLKVKLNVCGGPNTTRNEPVAIMTQCTSQITAALHIWILQSRIPIHVHQKCNFYSHLSHLFVFHRNRRFWMHIFGIKINYRSGKLTQTVRQSTVQSVAVSGTNATYQSWSRKMKGSKINQRQKTNGCHSFEGTHSGAFQRMKIKHVEVVSLWNN